MGRPAKYSEEFRRDAVELLRTVGRPIVDVATSLGIPNSTLHNWLKADRSNDPDALTEYERAELARLRKENIELRTVKELLRKAAVHFARETMR